MSVLPVTAIVVACNEASHLAESLPVLRRCAEVIVVDLESTDGSAGVAASHGATVWTHARVPIVEEVYGEAAERAQHDWILTTDPDERLPEALLDELVALLPSLDERVGLVYAPLQYYFAGRPLRGTIWGGLNRRRLLAHRARTEFRPNVHAGVKLRPGFRSAEVVADGTNVVRHFWSEDWRDLVAKHRRYLRREAESRHRNGELTRWRDVALAPLLGFHDSFVRCSGYLDGARGLGLSAFWAWYRTRSLLALRLHQRRHA